jgi:hypothetical protein
MQNVSHISCPQCKNTIQAVLEQIIDPAQDPSSKARLLSGSLNLIHCPVCGYSGQIAVPLVYHDAEKELLLTHIPMGLSLKQEEQERAVGQLINRVMETLPPEARKGYLLRPQTMLTMQSLIEKILEADGITHEEIEEQRARLRLFDDLLRTPSDDLKRFAGEHDAEMDEAFFQLASLSLRSTPHEEARKAATARLEEVLPFTSYGAQLKAKQEALRTIIEALRKVGEPLTREKLLEIAISNPGKDHLEALASLVRPALDYTFFQMLSERIDAAKDEEGKRLTDIRQQLLEITQEIDRLQELRAAQAVELLRSLLEAEDLDAAIRSALPLIDDFFLGTLSANLHAAKENNNQETLTRLQEIDSRLRAIIRESLPPGLRLAQEVLEQENVAQAEALLQKSAEHVDEDLLNALLAAAGKLEQSGDEKGLQFVKDVYRKALGISMRAKMQNDSSPAEKT